MTSPTLTSVELDDTVAADRMWASVLRSLHDSGMAIIEDVYTPAEIQRLSIAYHALLAARPEGRVQATSGEHHVQMQIPLIPPFSDIATIASPAVTPILSAVLGADFECSYYNSNTAYRGSTYQPVHRDSGLVFGIQHAVATPPTGIVVNIPLRDFTVDNGSTEVWPASHLIVDTPEDAEVSLDERTKALASSRLDIKAGSVALRDLRVWHRGTPNTTDEARSMLAIVYKRHWLGWRHPALRVPTSTWEAWPEHVRSIFATAPRDDDTA